MKLIAVNARNQVQCVQSSDPRPFLKWVGGKRQLLDELDALLPASYNRYYEPFIGGGALFFAERPRMALLSDANGELIDTYRAVRDCPEEVIAELEQHVYDKDYYYEMRAWDASRAPLWQRAARMIFLNRTGFNGLYRVNRAGQFNVPFGRYSNPTICDAENLRACSLALRGVELAHQGFEAALSLAEPGDFVYFDPPYVPLTPTSSFTSYVPGGFGLAEQEQLAEVFATLAARGVSVMLSNSDTELVRELYRGFHLEEVRARRSVNAQGGGRGKVGELVVCSDYLRRRDLDLAFDEGEELRGFATA
ncbi:MAG: DNA adenine methylase [Alphaproteobacteria bacterium]|nr:DNA adenine methylase [Alphaproteobacteria bacterium]MCB9795793.1 DNA adenine methylase [Alphaproteobacteria bacterium]